MWLLKTEENLCRLEVSAPCRLSCPVSPSCGRQRSLNQSEWHDFACWRAPTVYRQAQLGHTGRWTAIETPLQRTPMLTLLRRRQCHLYTSIKQFVYMVCMFAYNSGTGEDWLPIIFNVARSCSRNNFRHQNGGRKGQKIGIFRFSLHQPARHGRRWAALFYSLGQL